MSRFMFFIFPLVKSINMQDLFYVLLIGLDFFMSSPLFIFLLSFVHIYFLASIIEMTKLVNGTVLF